MPDTSSKKHPEPKAPESPKGAASQERSFAAGFGGTLMALGRRLGHSTSVAFGKVKSSSIMVSGSLNVLARRLGRSTGVAFTKMRSSSITAGGSLIVLAQRVRRKSREFVSNTWSMVIDFYLRLKIRWKLVIIVAASIVVVTVIISTVALNRQERDMRALTGVLGTNLVRNLANVAKDNLLLESYAPIQDYISNFSYGSTPGLEHFFVVNREGRIVAHLVADSINASVPADEWDIIAAADSATLIETETQLRFVQSVFVLKEDRKFILGGCSATFSKEIVLAAIAEMKERIILTSFVVSLLAISIVYFISTKIVAIIIVLSEAARKVGEGDLKVSVATTIKDELGVLAREFNLMVIQIREKTEMQKFVSRAAVKMLSEGKEAKLGGTRRVITAMFTDIRNFTTVSENQWPEEVVVTLNLYLDLQTKIIHNHGGVVDKFIGDGIMSIFTGNDMVKNAATAAVMIQQEANKMNRERKKEKEIVLEIGIGIATGVAVMGSIGASDRMDYTAIGDTVNLAARLCSAAEANEILATENVVNRLKGLFQSRSAGKIPIKGKQEKVAVYQIPYPMET